MHFRKIKRQQSEVYINEPLETDSEGNTLTIEAVAPAPGFSECFFGLDKLVLHLQ